MLKKLPTDTIIQKFKDPDPFQEFAFPNTIEAKKAISDYFTKLRPVKILIKGKDLQNMGLKPGPLYREIFQAVLDAKLNGKLRTRNDELEFAVNHVQ